MPLPSFITIFLFLSPALLVCLTDMQGQGLRSDIQRKYTSVFTLCSSKEWTQGQRTLPDPEQVGLFHFPSHKPLESLFSVKNENSLIWII